ncbi:cation-translocating P-type ATPase [Mucilaginibacter aquariorum]|uniref:Cation-translocating P-type ATPase n=1 Tax=Mucilaginibacter aquariorum TaxID=2967225 RepID=A0ABT1T8Z2_9SPHI|nr:cation-translocating P-type ATPase [Mucilaginibacter aquariorum]MCQ6961068.1 cation-translocating P-type ATPase [Mucilaginibacter aquariorum]
MNAIHYPLREAYSLTKDSIKDQLKADLVNGLTGEEVADRRQAFGENIIAQKKKKNPILIFLMQFASPMVYMLIVAAVLSFFFKEWLDGIAILVVIVINAVIGFLMEYQAERSMDALKRMTQVSAKVIRENNLVEIPAAEIVPGDILFLEAGDIIPADSRIFNSSQFQADESALTGESMPVEKRDDMVPGGTPLAERLNMVYKGTFVTGGNAKAIVTGTGMNSELGSIALMVQDADQTVTPLEKKLEDFSRTLIKITVGLVVVIFLAGILYGDAVIKMLETSIALAVAAIPEGLPIVATLALAQGMLNMARHNVIVKKLEAVETLGGTNVICTDKTGTLTQNKIEVSTVVTSEGRLEFKPNPAAQEISFLVGKPISESDGFKIIKKISVLCNTAKLALKNNLLEELGDPLETGLLKFAYSGGVDIESFRAKFPKIREEPFSSETRVMSTLHESDGRYFLAAKGAAEELLGRCTFTRDNGKLIALDETTKKNWITNAEICAASGLRIIAAAYREADEAISNLKGDLVFAGLIGMLDPPREEVFAAVRECKSAGIRVVMITGDHPATARNIALKLGILDSENDLVINGKEMNDFEDLSLKEKQHWSASKIFARVSPKQKLDLVSLLQEDKFVVGMTGDGVNDAPALKKADIGIAMGLRGTQVAQEVADMVLKDDSFSSIVLAIKQGRIIYENIRKFVVFLLSCNISELLIIAGSSILNLHFGLFPLQILYINIVTDVLPALALGVTKGSDSIMNQLPRDSNEAIIDRKRWKSISVYSLVITLCTLGAVLFTHIFEHKSETWNPELCNNILFITLILCQLWHVFNMSTENNKAFFKTDVFRNKYVWYATVICLAITLGAYLIPPVTKALSLYSPSLQDFAIMFAFSLLSLFINQVLKRLKVIF